MPITVQCEHCSNKGVYAVDTNIEASTMEISSVVNITRGQRHICQDIKCLVKELENQSRNFNKGRLAFLGLPRPL